MATHRSVRAAACVALLLAACTTAASVSPTAVAPGASTTAELTPEGQSAVVTMFGQRVVALEGRVVRRDDSSVRLAVTGVRRDNGVSESWPSDEITLPAGAVRTLRVRRLSLARSAVLGGAAAVAMYFVGRNLGGGTADGGRGGEPVTGK